MVENAGLMKWMGWLGRLALGAALLLGSAGTAQAASTYYVVFSGGSDQNPCTLAQPCSTIEKAADVAAGGDTILISQGVFEENLTIAKPLTLRGAGTGITIIDGNGVGRVLDINVPAGPGDMVTIEDLTIRNGMSGNGGGGIRVSGGSLTLRRVMVRGNQATDEALGGGLLCLGGTATILDSTLTANKAYGGAGAAVGAGCLLNMDGSTLYLNEASSAAGVLVLAQGTANLTNTTVSTNIANSVLLPAQPRAGGIEIREDGQASLNHCTLAHNFAVDEINDGWQVWAKGTLAVSNTILYGTEGPDCKVSSGAAFSSGGYNLSGDASCGLSGTGDLPNSDPLLGGLTDNGGPTFTHAVQAGSPAVDAGGPAGSGTPTHDQRGLAHRDGNFDGAVRGDIGAFEYQPLAVWLALVVK
jgi:hypothetical protein